MKKMYLELLYIVVFTLAVIIFGVYDIFLCGISNNYSYSKTENIVFTNVENKTRRMELLNKETETLSNLSTTEKFYYYLNRDGIVAHAGGEIDNFFYTNSVEALNSSYQKGIRIFEIDLNYTMDNKLVLAHGFSSKDFERFFGLKKSNNLPIKYNDFMKIKIQGKYTPMDIQMLINFMKKHKDVYIIPDIKNGDNVAIVKRAYKDIVRTAKYDSSILDRIVFTSLSPKVYNSTKNIYNFKLKMIHNRADNKLEERVNTTTKLAQYCKDNNIKNVLMSHKLYTNDVEKTLKEYDINVILFTVDSKDKIDSFRRRGVSGVATNVVSPIPFEFVNKFY